MGATILLQETLTLQGKTSSGTNRIRLNQPHTGVLDLKEHKDVSIRVQIHQMTPVADANYLTLRIQTASADTGPWKDLKGYEGYSGGSAIALPKADAFGASTGGAGATYQLERFVCWSVDPEHVASSHFWTICFDVWVTAK